MLKIYLPFKPFLITQEWGNPNPAYAAQFGDPNFKLHNGIDAKPDFNFKTWPVYCPVEGFKVFSIDYSPQGGGNEIWLISKEPLQMGDRLCHALLVLCHADKILVQAGAEPAPGELLMVGDSTGFSTGPHTHMGLYRVEYNGFNWYNKIDQNEATGSCNPATYFTYEYAIDKATLSTLIKSNWRYYQYKLGLR